jgi:hypothetical protein
MGITLNPQSLQAPVVVDRRVRPSTDPRDRRRGRERRQEWTRVSVERRSRIDRRASERSRGDLWRGSQD